MIDINWKVFEIKNQNVTESFESMCYFLFCRRHKLKEGIVTDFNQVGLETEPVKNLNGEYCGFQSKFFLKKVNYNDIYDSVKRACDNYPNLKHITIYLNLPAKISCVSAKNIQKICKEKKVEIEWFTQEQFKVILNQPENLDLAEFYFGKIDILNMLSDSKNLRINTLLSSMEYMELNLQNENSIITITEYCRRILESNNKLHLFTGAAGTGKSVCMRKILNIYGAFDEKNKTEQIRKIENLGAICIFINLNNTLLDSLEEVISSYKNIYYADCSNNKFIYLLDGFDEIPKENVDSTLLHIEQLLEKDETKKIVISSRLSSNNKFRLKATFKEIEEYTIVDLTNEQIHDYFDKKGDIKKINKFNEYCKEKEFWEENIKDILTLSLLWKYIDDINSESVFTDLMKINISTVLNDIHYRKYLEKLNLPNPKAESIININKRLALYLMENKKFSITNAEIQEIVGNIYQKCDYTSINEIVSFLADVFFDVAITENTRVFSYQHRRFLEYFTLLDVEERVQKDIRYLRKSDIIINKDLFEDMLIPYFKEKAIRNKDISLAFEVGMFNVYLGKDKAWGVDNTFYYWSRQIIYSISALPIDILQKAIHDRALPLEKFFNEIPEKIIKILSENENLNLKDDLKQYYINFVLLIVLLHKEGKEKLVLELLPQYEKIKKTCRDNEYYFYSINYKENYLFWRCILYIEFVIYDNTDQIINNSYQISMEEKIDDLLDGHLRIDYLVLNSLYYNLIRYYPEKCEQLIKNMDVSQLSIFALAAVNAECLNIIVQNNRVINELKTILREEIKEGGIRGIICISLKKFLGETITENEESIVIEYLRCNPFRAHSMFWKKYYDVVGFVIMLFKTEIDMQKLDVSVNRYVYAYEKYCELLREKCTITKFVSNIKEDINGSLEPVYYIRILLGKALSLCKSDKLVKSTIEYISEILLNGGVLVVYQTMKRYNRNRFLKAVNTSLVNKLNHSYIYKDVDYMSTSDLLFMLSFISADYNGIKSYDFLLKGLSNGVMRMDESKDTIGDYKLLESLEVILNKNWLSTNQIKLYLDRIILIASIMNNYHISNDVHGKTMEILQEYDFELAEYYYNKISNLKETYNKIHYEFAMELIRRGRKIDSIENCLNNIEEIIDRYYQKIEWHSLYYKITAYLEIASCDYYTSAQQEKGFKRACDEIQRMEDAGWNRELEKREYGIYESLCEIRHKKVDVKESKENNISNNFQKDCNDENNLLNIIKCIKSEKDLRAFINKMETEYILDNLNVNEQLLKKCIEITGNINLIISLLENKHYPSSTIYSCNSGNFWMLIVAALNNPKSKSSIFEYLIESGGGHDGFSELIKIYAFMDKRDVCMKAFETLLNIVEFLVC